MSSSKFTTIQSMLRLLEQMSSEKKYQLIRETITFLSIEQLEDLLIEIEQTIALKVRLEEHIEPLENTERGRKKIEIKKLNGKYYAYLRWWDKYLKSKYLGILPMQPGKTYRLTHKKHGTVKIVSVVSLDLEEDEQAYLQVRLLEPIQETRTFHYPKCFKEGNIFSQKDWEITPQLSSEFATTSDKAQLLTSFPATKTERDRQQKFQSVLQVKKSLTNELLAQLTYWENLSQALSTNPQWQLIKKSDKFVLQNQKSEIIVTYTCETQLLNSPHSAQMLLSWLRAIAWEVANSSFVAKQQQTLAKRFFIRLQAVPQLDNNKLFAYLLDLLT